MSMKSKILSNPNRKEAEKLFLQGVPILKIAKDLHLPYQPLYRHLTDRNTTGLSRQLKTAFKMQENEDGRNILNVFSNRIESLVTTLEDSISVLKEDEDYKKAVPILVPAIKELRSCYESLLKFEITTKEQVPGSGEEARPYWEQKLREEGQAMIHEMLDVLTPDEYELYSQLNSKMTSRDPDMIIKLSEKFEFEDVTNEPDNGNTIIPKQKDNVLDTVKQGQNTDEPGIEEANEPKLVRTRYSHGTTIIPSTNTDDPETRRRVKAELGNVPDQRRY